MPLTGRAVKTALPVSFLGRSMKTQLLDHERQYHSPDNPVPALGDLYLVSQVSGYQKALGTNSTSGSFSALVAEAAPPGRSETRAVFSTLNNQGRQRWNTLVVLPYGGDTNTDIMNVKVVGWNQTASGRLWVAELKCEIQATMSSSLPGLAGNDVVATEFFCDTLTLTTGVAVLYTGTADVDIAYFKVGISGFELVEILFDLGTGGNQMNALVRFDA